MQLDEVLDAFERDILRGRARWVADLDETFRNYAIGGHRFDMYARGQTRGRGFLLSRFFAWTVLPNYRVSLYARAVRNPSSFARESLVELLQFITGDMEKRALKWAWLVFLFDGTPPSTIANYIQAYDNNDIGVGSVNTRSGEVLVSKNLLGRSLLRYLRLDKLVPRLEHSRRRKSPDS